MKKGLFNILFICLAITLFSTVAMASDIVLTPFGQSPDAMIIKVVLKKLKIDSRLEKLLEGNGLKQEKVLIAVVGGSSKGLGAAGIDKDAEVQRFINLTKAAKSKGIKVLVMHIGGKARRGKLTDIFIGKAVPLADKLIVVDGGNHDGLFDQLTKGNKIEMIKAKSARQCGEPLKIVLSEWGVN